LNVSGNVIKRLAASGRSQWRAGTFCSANEREYSMGELRQVAGSTSRGKKDASGWHSPAGLGPAIIERSVNPAAFKTEEIQNPNSVEGHSLSQPPD
jgi:hypothetical protein